MSQDGSESTGDPREKEEQQGNGKPTSGAPDSYDPAAGEQPPDHLKEEFERGSGEGGFQAERKGEGARDAASSDDRAEPGKFKGFRKAFSKLIQERARKAKDE